MERTLYPVADQPENRKEVACVWQIDANSLESIAIGAGILGTGGGGNPYLGKLQVRRQLDSNADIVVVSLAEVPDSAVVTTVGAMGAPVVSVERISRGDEALVAMRALEQHIGTPITHLIPGEIGGSNAMLPMVISAMTGLPLIDGDGMGRAFPELQMDTFMIYGVPAAPAAIADVHHSAVVWSSIRDAESLERQARALTIQMGGSAGLAFPVLGGAQVKELAIPETISFARAIGDAVRKARSDHENPVEAIQSICDARLLFSGKIVDVERRMAAGFSRGNLTLEVLAEQRSRRITIEFQNENLIVMEDQVLASVPDLICIVDQDTAEPVTTELLRYGLRVSVLLMPAPDLLKTAAALKVVGPEAFGYDQITYRPMEGVYGLKAD